MKRAFAILVFAAACGGGQATTKTGTGTGVGNTGGDQPAVADPWIRFTQGATFELVNDEGSAITVTVSKVSPTADGRTIELEWMADGASLASGLPSTIAISKDRVKINELDFPLAREDHQPDGRVVSVGADGRVCYTDGPEDNAGDCPDVCEATLCVSAAGGLHGGYGTWWPDYAEFHSK